MVVQSSNTKLVKKITAQDYTFAEIMYLIYCAEQEGKFQVTIGGRLQSPVLAEIRKLYIPAIIANDSTLIMIADCLREDFANYKDFDRYCLELKAVKEEKKVIREFKILL